jgi:hypothetical protein
MRRGIIVLFTLILLTGVVLAAQPVPQGFNGNIIVKDGANPNGKILIGYVKGIATGQAVIDNGKFDIVITDNLGLGGTVEFKIGTEKAKETFTFHSFEINVTNLTFDALDGDNPCGNGICETGECSKCAVDCGINDCNNNSRCDVEIGEDCASSPHDCGVCLYCGDGVCNNGEDCSSCSQDCGACPSPSSGGGGGGGGGGGVTTIRAINSSNSSINLLQNNTENSSDISGLSIEQLNQNNQNPETKSGITGRSIIEFAKSKPGVGVIVILAVALIFGVIKFRHKFKLPKWKKNQ